MILEKKKIDVSFNAQSVTSQLYDLIKPPWEVYFSKSKIFNGEIEIIATISLHDSGNYMC